jgi:hypothetical protein
MFHRLGCGQSVMGGKPNKTNGFFEHPFQVIILVQCVSRFQTSLSKLVIEIIMNWENSTRLTTSQQSLTASSVVLALNVSPSDTFWGNYNRYTLMIIILSRRIKCEVTSSRSWMRVLRLDLDIPWPTPRSSHTWAKQSTTNKRRNTNLFH